MTTTRKISRPGVFSTTHRMTARVLGAVLLATTVVACQAKDVQITNPNSPSIAGASSDPAAVQLLATGLLSDYRASRGGMINDLGRFGRESYWYSPQEGRNTTHYLIGIAGANKLDPSGFASGQWVNQYGALRDNFNFRNTINASGVLSATQKSAGLGYAKTLEAAELLELISTRDTLGIVVQEMPIATTLAPFVSRDSAYKYIIAALDSAATALSAGGSAFPFTLHSGFAGFNSPSTFLLFNRALKARAEAYYATSGGGASAWQAALTALSSSFLNTAASTRSALDAGVYDVYSGSTGDVTNPDNMITATVLYAHESINRDVAMKPDGTPDNRYLAKIRLNLPVGNPPVGTGIPSTTGFSIWPTTSTPIAIIRNEELILLQAEAKLATGDAAGAIANINLIRTVSGGLAPTTLTPASAASDILTEILYNKRFSLLMEGHRWIDMRRYGRLSQLPLDISTGPNAHFVAKVMPVPQAECLVRVGKTGNLAGPGC